MSRTRQVAGGGILVEVEPLRLIGWVDRFGGRNGGVRAVETALDEVRLTAVDGTTATIAVPFPPMRQSSDPVQALVQHVAAIGGIGLIAVRSGAHSVGVARQGVVVSSRTDRAYLQGRTAAGGWSQQRFARRRGNQRTASLKDAADAVAGVLVPVLHELDGVVTAGDAASLEEVLADPRLAALRGVSQRRFLDIPEPRRSVLEDLAERALVLEIVVR